MVGKSCTFNLNLHEIEGSDIKTHNNELMAKNIYMYTADTSVLVTFYVLITPTCSLETKQPLLAKLMFSHPMAHLQTKLCSKLSKL